MELKDWLGKKVECRITGLRGVVTAYAVHMTGCDRLLVQPPVSPDGKMQDGYWCDHTTVDELDAPKVELKKDPKPGGPAQRFGENWRLSK